ncbi:penicillin-binding protein 1C [Roseivirga pacifica]|uniref:peptidoglycan glycosyltransferase n=1 Tax=Roseivirga pacifica TaxID=1267423 RepID=A0A1I0RHA6_9BACT|nr:penicillin-binding protein 1C [Roseivirga pacifica]RKQ49634.1 penicillin-binding protein 1C [Roseivirga pacifica]SEW40307.1 penicillin-binding protein 1C [Roseivirga pacifica]
MKKKLFKYRKVILAALFVLSVAYYFCLPKTLFEDPYATVLNTAEGHLLSARIADDGQWRFPEETALPDKYIQAVITFEDKNFYWHPGVDPLAFGRAMVQNLRAGHVVSGGSTLSMQVIRLHRKGKSRTIWEKLVEVVLATRLELRHSKTEILELYASHAPFGGNTVGLSAASWRYFERQPAELSWAEAALFAVLPNQPSMLFPGRYERALMAKRNRLLERLYAKGALDATALELAKSEPLPLAPNELPQMANHLLGYASVNGYKGQHLRTTLDRYLQAKVNKVLQAHHALLKTDGIHNAAALVLDVKANRVLAYAGNVPHTGAEHAENVDVIQAPRSTGSILKLFLYASMLDEGMILPKTLLPDVPMFFEDFAPKNFTRRYDGAVHADDALSRSLNIPMVHLLKMYGYPRFHEQLRNLGMSTLSKPAGHYGLTLVLGGAEGTLWDMANMYAAMSRTLSGSGEADEKFAEFVLNNEGVHSNSRKEEPIKASLSAASVWFTFQAMLEVYRPEEDASWKMYSSARKIAWKTGTSFGYRDGWAIGATPEYVVAVWVGNADGEGRPGLTGIEAAAPIMFDIFDALPETSWFLPPRNELTMAAVDRQSGYLASPYSIAVDTVFIPKAGLRTAASPYHQRVHLNARETERINTNCAEGDELISKNWFVLPAKQAHYFKQRNPAYQELPPLAPGCGTADLWVMDMVYPEPNASLYLPIEQDGAQGQLVFEVTHRSADATLYWHLDNQYLGTTETRHSMELSPAAGPHTITITDQQGNELVRRFEVIRSSD